MVMTLIIDREAREIMHTPTCTHLISYSLSVIHNYIDIKEIEEKSTGGRDNALGSVCLSVCPSVRLLAL